MPSIPEDCSDKPRLQAKVRLQLGGDIALGPGKAELLQHIDDTGSISAAARRMGMSYRRAWLLVETMNQCFEAPLVETAQGGKGGGGAQVSSLGHEVLAIYRTLTAELDAHPALLKLSTLLADPDQSAE